MELLTLPTSTEAFPIPSLHYQYKPLYIAVDLDHKDEDSVIRTIQSESKIYL